MKAAGVGRSYWTTDCVRIAEVTSSTSSQSSLGAPESAEPGRAAAVRVRVRRMRSQVRPRVKRNAMHSASAMPTMYAASLACSFAGSRNE